MKGSSLSKSQPPIGRRKLKVGLACLLTAVAGIGNVPATASAAGATRYLPTYAYCTSGRATLNPQIGPTPGNEYGQWVAYRFVIQDISTGRWYYYGNDRWGNANWYWKWTYTAQGDVLYVSPPGIDLTFPTTYLPLSGSYYVWTQAYWYNLNGSVVGSDTWPSVYGTNTSLFSDLPAMYCKT